MSKSSKSAAKPKRRSLKRSRKLAQQALYTSWATAGQNGSKRSKLKNKSNAKRTLSTTKHVDGPCGNCGCRTCNNVYYTLLTPRLIVQKHREDAERLKSPRPVKSFKIDDKPTLLGANFLS